MSASITTATSRGTRERVRDAAIQLFSRSGFSGTTTRELCEAAHVTKPVLYHYFATKEVLFRQIVAETLAEWGETIREAASIRGSARQRLVEVIWSDFQFTRRDPDLLRLMYRVAFGAEPIVSVEEVIQAARDELKLLAEIAGDGIRSGEWAGDPAELALSIRGLSDIQSLRYLIGGEGTLSRAEAERCVEIAMRGCQATRPGPAPRERTGGPGKRRPKRSRAKVKRANR